MADINYPIANKQEVDNLKQEVTVSLKTTRDNIDTLERSDIRLAGQINNLVETTKPLVPDVKVSTYNPVTTLSPNAQEGQMNVKVSGLTLKNEVVNGDFRDGVVGYGGGQVTSIVNGELEVTLVSVPTESNAVITKSNISGGVIGNKYYASLKIKPKYNGKCRFGLWSVYPYLDAIVGGVWNQRSTVITAVSDTSSFGFLSDLSTTGYVVGDKLYFKDFIVVDLTAMFGAGKEPTKEQMDEMVQHYFEGLTSVQAGTVKTTGKNLMNPYEWLNPYLTIKQYEKRTCLSWIANSGAVNTSMMPNRFTKGTVYSFSFEAMSESGIAYLVIRYTDGTAYNIFIQPSSFGTYRYVSTQGKTISNISGVSNSSQRVYIDASTFQIEEGATATPYEPYQETVYSLPDVKLHSLPNGVRDYIEGNKLVKNVQEYVLKAEDIHAVVTFPTNFDVVVVKNHILTDAINRASWANTYRGIALVNGYVEKSFVDNIQNLNTFYLSNDYPIKICVTKGTNIEQARTAMAGTKILYQLAEPVIAELPSQTLKSNPKGSVIYLPSRKVISTYTTKAENTVPIKTITKITKVLTNGTRIPISVNVGLTVATDKLSFTHTSLINGDNIEWEYDFDTSITTSPLIEYGYENSKGEFPCRNLVVNGDFSKGATGWIVESGITIIDGKMIFTNTVSSSKAEQTIIKLGDVYYSSFEISDYISGKLRIEHGVTSYSDFFSGDGKKSFLSKSLGNTSFNVRAMESSTNLKVDNVIVINLTETFGAGNEPTKEQMDKIMELHGGWFDGTVNPLINAKDMYKLLVKDVDTGWLNLTPLSGWSLGANGFLQVRKTRVGVVEFRANNLIAGTVTSYTNICSIPSSFIAFGTVAIIAIDGQNGNQVFLYYAGVNGSLKLTPNSGITTGMRLGFYAMWRTE